MHPWFVWIYWINPLAYALEALMSNELSGRILDCVGVNLVPSGEGYSVANAACAGIPGAQGTSVLGDAYLDTLAYSRSHLWRNFGIIWCWWALFVGLAAYFTTYRIADKATSSYLTFVRNKDTHQKVMQATAATDIEKQEVEVNGSAEGASSSSDGQGVNDQKKAQGELIRNTSVFTWRNLCYTVEVPGGERLLLDNINGYVKPGELGALMGSSGAGKVNSENSSFRVDPTSDELTCWSSDYAS